MKAYELMALAAKEPEKYGGKKYKAMNLCVIDPSGRSHSGFTFNEEGFAVLLDSDNWAFVNSHAEVEEIPHPVPFMEAVKAYAEGKTIRCEKNGGYKEFSPCGLKRSNMTFSANDILDNAWYIKEVNP
jgi:hypothetical protein